MIAEFIGRKDVQNQLSVGRAKARKIMKDLKESHPDSKLPNPYVIPQIWLDEVYGENAYKRKRKKDDSN